MPCSFSPIDACRHWRTSPPDLTQALFLMHSTSVWAISLHDRAIFYNRSSPDTPSAFLTINLDGPVELTLLQSQNPQQQQPRLYSSCLRFAATAACRASALKIVHHTRPQNQCLGGSNALFTVFLTQPSASTQHNAGVWQID